MNPFLRGGKIMLGIAWVLILGGLYWYFSDWQAREANPNPASVIDVQRGELTLTRNRAGHYVADGEINGRRVTFLLDTGATSVALPLALGRELDLKRGAAVTLQTAHQCGYEKTARFRITGAALRVPPYPVSCPKYRCSASVTMRSRSPRSVHGTRPV